MKELKEIEELLGQVVQASGSNNCLSSFIIAIELMLEQLKDFKDNENDLGAFEILQDIEQAAKAMKQINNNHFTLNIVHRMLCNFIEANTSTEESSPAEESSPESE